ncbi:hypothetical protein MSAN_01178300 [Mycena sanguinolenta]|uniref:Uncharacterized protein n=1 Tax=Mycena sanguinolenta TaxID=230812 RepID=A0A8H7D6S0_9AGAR|nr:hypothetical protein MSAN_01178300 [Mycena sanguinolenta]
MPEPFTMALAYGAYQGWRQARKGASRHGPPDVSSPDSETQSALSEVMVPKTLPRSVSEPEPTFLYPTWSRGQSRTLTRSVSEPDLTLVHEVPDKLPPLLSADILDVPDVLPGVDTSAPVVPEDPDVPEDADFATAIVQSLQNARMQQGLRSDILLSAEESLVTASVPDDLEDADLARAIAQSLQEMKLQQRPRLNILPTAVNTAAILDVPDNQILCPHSPATTDVPEVITSGVLKPNWEARTNEEFFSYSFEHSTSRYGDDLGEDALQPPGPLGASLVVAEGVRHTGGEGGRGEGPNLGQMSFHNSVVNLIINGGTGGDGGAAGSIGVDGGTGQVPIIRHATQTRRSSFSALPPLPPRPWRE